MRDVYRDCLLSIVVLRLLPVLLYFFQEIFSRAKNSLKKKNNKNFVRLVSIVDATLLEINKGMICKLIMEVFSIIFHEFRDTSYGKIKFPYSFISNFSVQLHFFKKGINYITDFIFYLKLLLLLVMYMMLLKIHAYVKSFRIILIEHN